MCVYEIGELATTEIEIGFASFHLSSFDTCKRNWMPCAAVRTLAQLHTRFSSLRKRSHCHYTQFSPSNQLEILLCIAQPIFPFSRCFFLSSLLLLLLLLLFRAVSFARSRSTLLTSHRDIFAPLSTRCRRIVIVYIGLLCSQRTLSSPMYRAIHIHTHEPYQFDYNNKMQVHTIFI